MSRRELWAICAVHQAAVTDERGFCTVAAQGLLRSYALPSRMQGRSLQVWQQFLGYELQVLQPGGEFPG